MKSVNDLEINKLLDDIKNLQNESERQKKQIEDLKTANESLHADKN